VTVLIGLQMVITDTSDETGIMSPCFFFPVSFFCTDSNYIDLNLVICFGVLSCNCHVILLIQYRELLNNKIQLSYMHSVLAIWLVPYFSRRGRMSHTPFLVLTSLLDYFGVIYQWCMPKVNRHALRAHKTTSNWYINLQVWTVIHRKLSNRTHMT